MNSQVILIAVTFLAAATLVLGASLPNSSAPPVLLTAVAPNPGDPNLGPQHNPGQPGGAAEPGKGDSDDQEAAGTFGIGIWGGWGGWGGGFGGYPYWGGYRGYYPYYRRYGGYYGYGGGYPYYGGYYGW